MRGSGVPFDEAARRRSAGLEAGDAGGGGEGHRGVHGFERERGRIGLDDLGRRLGQSQEAAGVGVPHDVPRGGKRGRGDVGAGPAGAAPGGAGAPGVTHFEAQYARARGECRAVPGETVGRDHRPVAERALDAQRAGRRGTADRPCGAWATPPPASTSAAIITSMAYLTLRPSPRDLITSPSCQIAARRRSRPRNYAPRCSSCCTSPRISRSTPTRGRAGSRTRWVGERRAGLDGTRFGVPQAGAEAELSKTVTVEDLELFAQITGDRNPLHFDPAAAEASRFGGLIAQGGVTSGL